MSELHDYLASCRTIRDAWAVYDRAVLPKNAHPIQRIETKRSFYAGVDWMLRRITIASEGDEDDAVALLSEFDDELRLYALTESSEVLPVGMRIEEPFDLEKFPSQEALDASGYVPISDEEVAELSKMTPEERGRWLAQNAARKKREARTNELRRRLDEIEKKRSTLGRGGRL